MRGSQDFDSISIFQSKVCVESRPTNIRVSKKIEKRKSFCVTDTAITLFEGWGGEVLFQTEILGVVQIQGFPEPV